MEQPKIIINTSMSKEDYRKFLYLATFKRNKFVIPLLGLISLLGSIVVTLNDGYVNFIKLITSWVLLLALSVVVVLLKVEKKNAQRKKTDKTGTFDSVNTLKFYDDRIVMENESLKFSGELRYDQFFALMESKDYFIFYLTANQASLVRKRDVEGLDKFKDLLVEKFKGRYRKI